MVLHQLYYTDITESGGLWPWKDPESDDDSDIDDPDGEYVIVRLGRLSPGKASRP